jgi:hypothetical protein
MREKLLHVLLFTPISHGRWGANGGPESEGDAEKEEARVMKAWPTPFAKASGLIAGMCE